MSEMTATRMGHPLRLATLAVLAAVWAAAAYFLWASTKVPDGLQLTGVSTHTLFGAAFLHRAEHYESFFYWLVLGQTIVTVVVFALYAWRGARFAKESAAGPIGTGMLLAMLGFALVWLVSVPVRARSPCGGSGATTSPHESYRTVIFGGWLALGVEFLLLCVAVADRDGAGAVAAAPLVDPGRGGLRRARSCCCTFTSPYLVAGTHPLRDPQLKAAAARIADKEGVHGVPIGVEDVYTDDAERVHDRLRAVAQGRSSGARCSTAASPSGELEAVVAHEFGHQARNHLLKGIAWYALVRDSRSRS